MTQLTTQQQLTHLRRQLAQVEREITELVEKRQRLLVEFRQQSQLITDALAAGWLEEQGRAAVEWSP